MAFQAPALFQISSSCDELLLSPQAELGSFTVITWAALHESEEISFCLELIKKAVIAM